MGRLSTLRLVAVLILGAGTAEAVNSPPTMIVLGQFNVSATDAATYSMPIAVPPDMAGMVVAPR